MRKSLIIARWLLTALAVSMALADACAQSASTRYVGGKAVGPGNPMPIGIVGPSSIGTHVGAMCTLSPTTVMTLANCPGGIPAGAAVAYMQCQGQNVRFTSDGLTTPTSTVGKEFWATSLMYALARDFPNLEMIQESAGAHVVIDFYSQP